MLTLTDKIKAAGQDTVVHRGGVRRRHRLADHRLDRGPCPATRRPGQLRQVGHGRAEVQQPGDQAGVRVLPEDRLHRRATSAAAPRPSSRRTSRPAATRCSKPRPAATCSSRPASSPARVASRTRCIAQLDTKVGVTAFPPKTEGDNPVLSGGDLASAFNNDANTLKLRNFIASKENGIEAGKAGYFSPHKTSTSRSTRTRRCRRSPGGALQGAPRRGSTGRT